MIWTAMFWVWQVGERKEPSSKNRKDRRKRRWRHEEERMRHVLPVHLCYAQVFAVASEADGPLGASGRRGRALLSPPLAASL